MIAKVIYTNCDVFSLGVIKRVDGTETDDLLNKLNNPNNFQTLRQWLWSYRFWTMVGGNAYLRPSSKIITERNQLYWLNNAKMSWDTNVLKKLDQMVLSKSSLNGIKNSTIQYDYLDGTTENIALGDLVTFTDTTNNINNWYGGNSRLDALYKVVGNIESNLDAKNINLEFSRKFLVSGEFDPTKNLASFANMDSIEREDIEAKLRGRKAVLPLKSKVSVERFSDDLAKLKLDESYNAELYKVAELFNVPKELVGSDGTYENQEKALARHISYSETPKSMDLLEGVCRWFGKDPKDYVMTWEDQPYMQVFEKDRAIVKMTNARTLESLIRNGVPPNEAADYLGMDFNFKPQGNGNGNE